LLGDRELISVLGHIGAVKLLCDSLHDHVVGLEELSCAHFEPLLEEYCQLYTKRVPVFTNECHDPIAHFLIQRT
jgi:hypothetical protein